MDLSGGGVSGGGCCFQKQQASDSTNSSRGRNVAVCCGDGGEGFPDNGGRAQQYHHHNEQRQQQKINNNYSGEGEGGVGAAGIHRHHNRQQQQQQVDDDDVDEIARALNALTFQQREQVYNDIHGIVIDSQDTSRRTTRRRKRRKQDKQQLQHQRMHHDGDYDEGDSDDDESEKFIYQCINEMNRLIDLHIAESNDDDKTKINILQEAIDQDPSFVRQDLFLLMFLRADEYNTTLAFDRMIRFLEYKKLLWGLNKLTKPITQADFVHAGDLMCLQSGGAQIVSIPDNSGRYIIVNAQNLLRYKRAENIMRTLYYMLMSLLQNRDIGQMVQTRGIVELAFLYGDGGPSTIDNTILEKCRKLQSAIPYRAVSTHICTEDSFGMRILVKVMRPFMNIHSISRFQIHTGTHPIEIQYKLLSYGIPLNALPVDMQFNTNNHNHLLWLQQQKLKEQLQFEEEQREKQRQQQQRQRQVQNTMKTTLTAAAAGTTRDYNTERQALSSDVTFSRLDQDVQQHQQQQGQQPWSKTETASEASIPSSSSSSVFAGAAALPSTNHDESGIILVQHPGLNAVILGRGHFNDNHIGNIQFRHYLQQPSILQIYKDAPIFCKRDAAQQILTLLQQFHPITFLKEYSSNGKKDDGNDNNNDNNYFGSGIYHLVDNDDVAVIEKIQRTIRRAIQQQQKKEKGKLK